MNSEYTRIFLKNYSEFEKDNFKKLTNIKNINIYTAFKNKKINKFLFNKSLIFKSKILIQRKIYLYSLITLTSEIENLRYNHLFQLTKNLNKASILIGLDSHLKKEPLLILEAKKKKIPILGVKQPLLNFNELLRVINKLINVY